MTKQERMYTMMLEEALCQPRMLQGFRGDLLRHDRKTVLEGKEDAVYTWALRGRGTFLGHGMVELSQHAEVVNVYTLDVYAGTLTPAHMTYAPERR